MTSKERIWASLNNGPCDRVPVVVNTRTAGVRLRGYALSEAFRDPEVYVESQLWLQNEVGYDAVFGQVIDPVACVAGSQYKMPEDIHPTIAHYALADTGNIGTLPSLDPSNSQWHDYLSKIVAALHASSKVPVVGIFRLPFMTASDIVEPESLLKSFYRQPTGVLKLMDMLVEPSLKWARSLLDAGADLLWTPLATVSLMSRAHYQKYVHPYHLRVLRELRDAGATVIVHLCGEWGDKFDIVAEEDASVWHVDNADLGELRRSFPQIALMGKVHAVNTLFMSTPERVFDEAQENIRAVGRTGLLLSGNCGLAPATPLENLRALVEASRQT